jgi:predicted nuclease of restriction endonuclease-like (RecB) superfamily
MRKFFLLWRDRPVPISQKASAKLALTQIGQTPSDQLASIRILQKDSDKSPFTLSWSHYVLLLTIKNPDERNFYEIEAAQSGWSQPELKRQVASCLYERLALSKDKGGVRQLANKGQIIGKPEDVLKEPYVLEFLGLDEKAGYSESDMETAIIDRLEQFLLELGKGFLFEARQKRFTFDEDHFFVDLVFYNRLLRSYVIIDLKLEKLSHQDLGQMQMYVNYFDRFVKTPDENPTIGILLCKRKKDAIVELTLPADANIHAREYALMAFEERAPDIYRQSFIGAFSKFLLNAQSSYEIESIRHQVDFIPWLEKMDRIIQFSGTVHRPNPRWQAEFEKDRQRETDHDRGAADHRHRVFGARGDLPADRRNKPFPA